jgi:hypothetical protein
MSTQACHKEEATANRPAAAIAAQSSPAPLPEFVNEPFETLYPIFLLRKVKAGPKSALWRNYFGRWVRWTGTIRSFTANGVTLKVLPQTVTFDISLWIEPQQRKDLRAKMKLGDQVRFVGRLDSYDDIFRTMYLVHGVILENLGAPDGGT